MEKVCVTGASGFIASWIVKMLLEKGYHVRATVRSLANEQKVAHLRNLTGASQNLELVEADLLEDGSFKTAVSGCQGVFHTASPFFTKNITNPQVQLLDPAVKGTLNVLQACSDAAVKKIVITPSTAAVAYDGSRKPDDTLDETFFSNPEYCKEKKLWYMLSKTLAENVAWKFAKEKGLNVVTIHPAMVIGQLLQPTLNTSNEVILNLLDGSMDTYPNTAVGWVGVKDTARAHILAYENPDAEGRYLCIERVVHYGDLVKILKDLYPGYPIPTRCADETGPRVPAYKFSCERLKCLGLRFTSLDENIKECVECLKERGLLQSI